jgi:thiazole tautomerase (transcriptional regulator TenI)
MTTLYAKSGFISFRIGRRSFIMSRQLHVISTGKQSIEVLVEILEQIHPLVDYFHLREKQWTAKDLMKAVMDLTEKGVPLDKIIINDRADVALAAGTKGVHLAYHSLAPDVVKKTFPQIYTGCSIHSLQEAMMAEKKGADYVFYGHIFSTSSKPGITPRGVTGLSEITNQLKIPVIGIGGIQPENAEQVLGAGAAGIAVMSGILEHENPLKAAKMYREILDNWSEKHE